MNLCPIFMDIGSFVNMRKQLFRYVCFSKYQKDPNTFYINYYYFIYESQTLHYFGFAGGSHKPGSERTTALWWLLASTRYQEWVAGE